MTSRKVAARSGTGRDSEDGSGVEVSISVQPMLREVPFLLSYQQFALAVDAVVAASIFTFN